MRIHQVWALIAVPAFVYCVWRIAGFVRQYQMGDIIDWFGALPTAHIVYSIMFAAASYATLTGFDYIAVGYAGHRLPYRKVALASFVSLGLGYPLGPAPLGTGAVRYFCYSRLGLGLEAFARLALLIMITTVLGKISFAGLSLLLDPSLAAGWFGFDQKLITASGVLALACIAAYVLLCACCEGEIVIRAWRFPVPNVSTALAQVALGTLDYFLIAACLHQLMSAANPVSFITVANSYVFANLAVFLTHVPGGWGVMEFVILSLVPEVDTIGALVAFRAIYYLVPLALALTLLISVEGWRSIATIKGFKAENDGLKT